MRRSSLVTTSTDGTVQRRPSALQTPKSFRRRTISLGGGCNADGESHQSPSQRGPRRATSAWNVARGVVRDLQLLRETYSTAREVYTQLKDRRFEAKGGEYGRFLMAGYSVLTAVRTALQKKRYQLRIAKQKAIIESQFFQALQEEDLWSSLMDAPDVASGESQSFQVLEDAVSDTASGELVESGGLASGELVESGGLRGCINKIHEMLQSSTDDHEIDERVSALIEDITKTCGMSYDKAYELSQSLRSSLDQLLSVRSQMDDLPVQSAFTDMQDLLGPPPPLGLTEHMPGKEAPKPRRTSRVHWRGALAEQDTSAANEEQVCTAGEGASSLAQNRLTTQERRLAMMERCKHAHTGQKASAWLHDAQGELEATVAVKSTVENQTGMDQVTQPPSFSADTCSGDWRQDLSKENKSSHLLQRQMSGEASCGSAGVQALDSPGWRNVAQTDRLLPLSSTTDHSDGRQDDDIGDPRDIHDLRSRSRARSSNSQAVPEDLEILRRSDGTCSKKARTESTKTSADDAILRCSQGGSCLQVATRSILNIDGSYLLDDEAFDDLAESVRSPSKAERRPRSLRPLPDARASSSSRSSRPPHGGISAAEGPQDPWDEIGSPSVSRSAAPLMTPQERISTNTMDIGSQETIVLPDLAAGAKGMPALETPSIHRHSVRLASSRRTKTYDLEEDEMAEGLFLVKPSHSVPDTALEMAGTQAEAARWAMRGRMRSKESTKTVAFAATTAPEMAAAEAEATRWAMRGRMGSKDSTQKVAVATTTFNMAAAQAEATRWAMSGRMGSKDSTKKVAVSATTAPEMAAAGAEAAPWAVSGRMGSKDSTKKVAVSVSAGGGQVQDARERAALRAGPPDASLPRLNLAVAASNQPMLLPPLHQPWCLPEDLHTASFTPEGKDAVHQPTPPTSPAAVLPGQARRRVSLLVGG